MSSSDTTNDQIADDECVDYTNPRMFNEALLKALWSISINIDELNQNLVEINEEHGTRAKRLVEAINGVSDSIDEKPAYNDEGVVEAIGSVGSAAADALDVLNDLVPLPEPVTKRVRRRK